ncbi:MAG: flagellar motor protein MotB, partial [Pseudomonadota bacterium]
MSQPPDAPAPEIVIVRRKRGGDEGHHGGVWKIAYADFMTAMMAFFLVMWLVNASNTEMKASVAAYFNPMQLTDSSARARGIDSVEPKVLKSEGDKHVTKKKPQETSTSNRSSPDGTARRKHDIQKDSNLISDPYKIAQLLGADEGPAGSKSRSRDKYTENTTAAISGRAYVDPFNPVSPLDIAPSESGIPGVPTGPSADAKNRKDDEGVAARKYGQLASPPKTPGKGPYATPARPDVAGKSKTVKENKTAASKSGTASPNAGTAAVPKAPTAENAKTAKAKTPEQIAREKKAARAKEAAEQRALVRAAKALSAEIKKALGKSAGAGPKIQVGTENK